MKQRKLRKSVRYALILRHTLKEKLKTINPHLMNSYCYSGRPVWASCLLLNSVIISYTGIPLLYSGDETRDSGT